MTDRRYGPADWTVDEVLRTHAEHTLQYQLALRVRELEGSQRTMLGVVHDFGIAGMDERGPYQIGADGCRHDADCNYVCHVAAETIRGLEGAIEDWKAHVAKLEGVVSEVRERVNDMNLQFGQAAHQEGRLPSTCSIAASARRLAEVLAREGE